MARALPLLACGLVCLLLLARGLGSEVLAGGDLLIFSYPRYALLGERLAAGELPRWNPWVYHGASWWGPRAGGVVYPLNALFALAPLGKALALFVALHLLIGARGAERLARRLGQGTRAAWAAGLAYGLGGFLVSMHPYPPFLISGAWLPWALAAAVEADRRPGPAAAGVGLAIGCILLGCEPQGAVAAALAALGVAALTSARRGRAALATGVGVGLSGLLAGAVVLSILTELPTLDRALTSFDDVRWRLSPGLLADLLVAGALGDRAASLSEAYWGYALWGGRTPWCGLSLGTVGLILAVAGCARPSRARRVGLALAALGLALGLSRAGQGIGLRFPAKWMVLCALGLALLAAAGLEGLLRSAPRCRQAASVGAAALGLGAGLAWVLTQPPAVGEWLAGWDPDGRPHPRVARAALSLALGRTALLAGAGWVVLRARVDRRRAAILLGLLAGELVHVAGPSLRTLPAEVLERPALADVVTRATGGLGPPRLDSISAVAAGRPVERPGLTPGQAALSACVDLLLPDVGIRHGVRSVLAFETVRPAEIERLRLDPRVAELSLAQRAGLIDAASFVVAEDAWAGLPAAARAEFEQLARYELFWPPRLLVRPLQHPPWAYLAPRGQPVGTLAEARAATLTPERDPLQTVVVGPEGEPAAGVFDEDESDEGEGEDAVGPADEGEHPVGAGGLAPVGTVTLTAFEPEHVSLHVQATRPGWLVVRDAFATGWSATLDAEPTALTRADVLYRAVWVPAGEHTVAFRYAPLWWWPGWICSLLGLVGVGIAARQGRGVTAQRGRAAAQADPR